MMVPAAVSVGAGANEGAETMNTTTDIGQSYTDRLTPEELQAPAFSQEGCDALQREFSALSEADRKIAMRGGNRLVLRVGEISDGRIRIVPAWNATVEDLIRSSEFHLKRLCEKVDKANGWKPGTAAARSHHREVQHRRKKLTVVGPDYSDEDQEF